MTASTSRRALRRSVGGIVGAVAMAAALVVDPPTAWADELVTYEVVSDHIHTANIQYQDGAGRSWAVQAPLPWRVDTTVRSVREAPPTGSQVRAHWREKAAPGKWVTVRIIYQGDVICQNTLDLGNAACYGITNRIT